MTAVTDRSLLLNPSIESQYNCLYLQTTIFFFFKIFFDGHIHLSYFVATGIPVLDFWWRLLWVLKPEWVLSYSHCGGKSNVHSLRSTSGATHCQPLDGQHCRALTTFTSCPRILLAPVRLEPTIIRLWVLRASPGPQQSSLQLEVLSDFNLTIGRYRPLWH